MAVPPALKSKQKSPEERRWTKVLHLFLRLVIAFFLSLVITQIKLDYIDFYIYDLWMVSKPHPKPTDTSAIILANLQTVNSLGSVPNFEHHLELVRKLTDAKVKRIVFLDDLREIEGTFEQKEMFGNFVKEHPGKVFNLIREFKIKGQVESLNFPPPLDAIQVESVSHTADTQIFANDQVTRRTNLSYQGQDFAILKFAQEENPSLKDKEQVRGRFEFMETEQVWFNYMPRFSIATHEYNDVIVRAEFLELLRDRTIFVGNDLNNNVRNYVRTPYSREVNAMTVTEAHAIMLDSLIRNDAIIRAPEWIIFLLTLLITILTVHVVLTFRPLKGLVIILGTTVGLAALSFIPFLGFNYWIPIAPPLLAIFISYYFIIPYRLIIENRRSWEYYQSNKLLSQVEELKTNFISMMSHDLKTPIARIQGMTDVIVRGEKLTTQQREAVETIKHSSDDLLKFINSILNYGKIESQGVVLQIQSRDLNEVVEDVIRKHDFMVKLKKMQIVAHLEPQFPIQVDPELIRQVLSNLVENAIKYSPDGTEIRIQTKDLGEYVRFEVTDQGPGIPADELPNIFMKFFRSKNAKASPIKGSGLGLYLAKYFVELHQGKIWVESSYGNGATFVVELPMEQGRKDVKGTRR